MRPKTISIKEASQLLNLSADTLRRWTKQGKIKALRFGKRRDRRFYRQDVEKILRKNRCG